jgi:hypothetical protein
MYQKCKAKGCTMITTGEICLFHQSEKHKPCKDFEWKGEYNVPWCPKNGRTNFSKCEECEEHKKWIKFLGGE